MNQEQIGKFIAECRKNKNMTQAELAEKLHVTDRAISKWERGKGLPDSSIMLELSKYLDISVNELLSGERLKMENYNLKAEENLLNLKRKEEYLTKSMLLLEWVIGIISTITLVTLLFVAIVAIESITLRIILISIGIIIFIIGVLSAIKIEQAAGYYECQHCHHKYIPTYKAVLFSIHMGRTRHMKCPECQHKSWNKKVIK